MGAKDLPLKLYRACRTSGSTSFNSGLRLWRLPFKTPFFSEGNSPDGGPSLACNYIVSRILCNAHVSELGPRESNRVLFLDTLALVRKLEAQGFSVEQAEAITSAVTDVLNDCLKNVAHCCVSKSELQRSDWLRENAVLKLKTDVQISQDNGMAALQRDIEKLRSDIDKLRSQMRFEMDKISAGQLLDLNLERGRMIEELAKQRAETSNLTNKLDMVFYITIRRYML